MAQNHNMMNQSRFESGHLDPKPLESPPQTEARKPRIQSVRGGVGLFCRLCLVPFSSNFLMI